MVGSMHDRGGGCVAGCVWHVCLPVDRMTDACKNIKLPQAFSDCKKMATEGGRIDFMFLGPLTWPLDPLLIVGVNGP